MPYGKIPGMTKQAVYQEEEEINSTICTRTKQTHTDIIIGTVRRDIENDRINLLNSRIKH